MKFTWSTFKKEYIKNAKTDTTKIKYFTKNIDSELGKYVLTEMIGIQRNTGIKDWSKLHDIYVHSIYTGISYEESSRYQLGKGDAGVDSFFVNSKTNTLILIQSKLKKIKNNFIDSMKRTYDDYIIEKKPIKTNDEGFKKVTEYLKSLIICFYRFFSLLCNHHMFSS